MSAELRRMFGEDAWNLAVTNWKAQKQYKDAVLAEFCRASEAVNNSLSSTAILLTFLDEPLQPPGKVLPMRKEQA